MSDGWQLACVEDLAEVFDGPHATPTKTEHGPWYLSISSLKNGKVDLSESAHLSDEDFPTWTRRVQPKPGDTLFSYETRLGEAGHWSHKDQAALGRRMGLLRPRRDRVDARFLTYAYIGPQFQTEIRRRSIHGATVDRIPIAEIGQWPIAVPLLDEQHRIASVLGALDDLIDTNHRISVDLEYLLAAKFALAGFDKLSNDGHRLADLISINPPYRKPRTDAPYIDMAALPTDRARVAGVVRRAPTGGARFQNGDTVMARITPCLENGKTAYIDLLGADEVGIGSTEFIVLRSEGMLGHHWSYFLARSLRFREYAVQHMSGTSGRQRCPADAVERYPIATPDHAAASSFAQLAGVLFEAIRKLDDEAHQAARARDELLPLLLSGQVRVEDVAA